VTKPTRVLVVEDEGVIAAHIQAALRRLGYEVAGTADSGAEALELIASLSPDVVLLDIGLRGGVDGVDTGAAILARRGPRSSTSRPTPTRRRSPARRRPSP
jgi:CheY-like chemotaxis protein